MKRLEQKNLQNTNEKVKSDIIKQQSLTDFLTKSLSLAPISPDSSLTNSLLNSQALDGGTILAQGNPLAGAGGFDPDKQRVHLIYSEMIQNEIEREKNVMKGCMEKVKTNYVKNNH